MAKQGNVAVTPRMRFPEYRKSQAWLVKRFEQLLTIGSGRDYKHLRPGDVPVYGSGGYMLSVDDYLYDGESACIGRKGTIDRPIFLSGKFWTVDTLFYTHSFIGCLPKFVFLHFLNIDWQKHNEAGGVPSLSKSNIEKIEVAVPSLAEQQKIAACLTSLDEVIAEQGRIVAALKAHKRGLMQQLFPREGETRPCLRFPEFRGAPAWDFSLLQELEDKKLIELGRGNVISHDDMRASPGLNPVYSSSVINQGLMGTYAQYMFDEELISWSIDGGGHFFHRPKHKFSVTNVSGFMRVLSSEIVCRFLAYQLQKLHASHTFDYQQKAHPSVIRALYRVGLPSPEEQQRIADCLSSLDTQIAAESNQLVALKTHKQGLMQQLFPAPEKGS